MLQTFEKLVVKNLKAVRKLRDHIQETNSGFNGCQWVVIEAIKLQDNWVGKILGYDDQKLHVC